MKRIILICSVVFLTSILSGQEIGISITPIYNVFHTKQVYGQTFGSHKLGLSANFDYLFAATNKNFKFGFGLGYHTSKVLNVIPISSEQFYEASEKINLCSFSFKSIYNLSKEFYLGLDPIIGFQINHSQQQITDNQSGIGISLGIGGNFRLNNYLLFKVEPRLWMFNLIPFHDLDSPFRLAFAGINLGLVLNHKID